MGLFTMLTIYGEILFDHELAEFKQAQLDFAQVLKEIAG